MSTTTELAKKLMTSDDLFAMRPSKKVDRWLFRGELRESKVTKRNPSHSATVISAGAILFNWLRTQPQPRARVYGGEAYFRIRQDPESNVGIDVALSTPDQKVTTEKRASFVDGPPVIAVEVLSPYDKVKDIGEAIEEYLDCGAARVWIIDSYSETLTVYRSGHEPVFHSHSDEFSGDDALPGLKFKIAELFE